MPKGYWVVTLRSLSRPEALPDYAKVAGPAVAAAGGRALIRGTPVKAHEAGLLERTVVIEFDSVETAIATYEGEGYQAAIRTLGDAAVRDFRIVEGVA